MKKNIQNFRSLETKIRLSVSRFGWLLAVIFGLWAALAQGEEFRYRYVALDQIELPPGHTSFFPSAINNNGLIVGSVCDDEFCENSSRAFYKDGDLIVTEPGAATVVNSGGTVGGSVLLDTQIYAPALIRKNKVELIPQQPGEAFEFFLSLNDRGEALLETYNEFFEHIAYVFYSNGKATTLDFGPTITNPVFRSFVFTGKFLNNNGIIAGTTSNLFNGVRGFRYDTRTGKAMLLNPLPSDTIAWGLGINNRGGVLGYSFVASSPYHENIGIWDSNGHFKTYFTETISSNSLVFNDNNLIVITLAPGGNSYLIPKPGIRLNLADLVENLPSGETLYFIYDINNRGDMLGFGGLGSIFLLKRLDDKEQASSMGIDATSVTFQKMPNRRQYIPSEGVSMLLRHMPPLKPGLDISQDTFKNLLLK